MRKILAAISIVCFCHHSVAQPFIDLASAYYSYSPGKGVNTDNALKEFNHFRGQLSLPVVFKKDSSVLLINPAYEQRWVSINESQDAKTLTGLFLWISFTKKLNNRWAVMLSGIPRWNGETAVPFNERFQMGGVVLVTRTIHPQLKFKAGLYYNKEFFGNFFMPVMGIEWKINKNSYLFGNLPSYLTYENRVNNWFSWGGTFRTFPNSYRIVPTASSIPYNDYYRTTDIQLGLYTDLYLTPKIAFSFEGGYAVSRKLRIGTEKGGGRDTETTISDKGNFYIRASLQYRLRFY